MTGHLAVDLYCVCAIKSPQVRKFETLHTIHSTQYTLYCVLCNDAYRQDYDGKTDMTCRPVNLLVAAYGPECGVAVRLGSATSTPTVLQSQVTQATVPAPALLLHSALGSLLLTLEVRLGEGLHRGQQTNLAHLPAEGDRRLPLLAAVEVHDVSDGRSVRLTVKHHRRESLQKLSSVDSLPGESDQMRDKEGGKKDR